MPNKNYPIKRFITYGVVGVLAFASEYFSFIIIIHALTTSYSLLVAQSISFSLGLIVSFTGNRFFSFNDASRSYTHNIKRQVGMYLVLAGINLLLSNIVIQLLVNVFLITPPISKLIVMSMVVLWNYIIFNKLIFKSERH
jgi:putative flippase GtrA